MSYYIIVKQQKIIKGEGKVYHITGHEGPQGE
jgi:hypothetical protein